MGRSQKYEVHLTKEERNSLIKMAKGGSISVREANRIQALLHADKNLGPGLEDEEVSKLLNIGTSTVQRMRVKFTLTRLEGIKQKKGAGRPVIIDSQIESQILSIAKSTPPKDKNRWTLRMIADKLLESSHLTSISHQSVKTTLKKMNFAPL